MSSPHTIAMGPPRAPSGTSGLTHQDRLCSCRRGGLSASHSIYLAPFHYCVPRCTGQPGGRMKTRRSRSGDYKRKDFAFMVGSTWYFATIGIAALILLIFLH